jgi:cytochrome c biogenesis protein CcdA
MMCAGLLASAVHAGQKVVVEIFGEAGCEACLTVHQEILPGVQQKFGDRIAILDRDIYEATNYVALATYQEHLGIKRDDPVSVVVDGSRYLGGVAEIRRDLASVIESCLHAGTNNAVPATVASADEVSKHRLTAISTAGIALAGLVDGVNPCAFATVVFLASLLAVSKVRGRGVLAMGGGFLLGTYVTYFLLGLGLFHGLKALEAWHGVVRVVNVVMSMTLAILAVITFRDAWRFHHTGKSSDVTLKMPDALRRRVHGMLKDRMTSTHLLLSGIVAGTLATLVGSVCTGQLYVPTLMVVAHNPELRMHALRLLAIYNLTFLGPVIVVMIAAWLGTSGVVLADWSRRNVVWGKILLGLFFAILAVLIVAL